MWSCSVWGACVLFFFVHRCADKDYKFMEGSSCKRKASAAVVVQRFLCFRRRFFAKNSVFFQRFLHNTALTSMPLFTRSPSSLWGRSFLKCFRTALRFDRFRRGEQHRNIFQDKSCETSATGLLDTRRRLASKLKIQQSQGMKCNEGSLCNCKCPPRKAFFSQRFQGWKSGKANWKLYLPF